MRKTFFFRIANYKLLPKCFKSSVVAVGNFDGVHRGHQKVLYHALEWAKKLNKPALVFTFEPHPRTIFFPKEPVVRLTSATQKAEIFRFMGFDGVIEQTFNQEFSNYTAQAFVGDILYSSLGIYAIVTGENFHFGWRRQGNPLYLQKEGAKYGLQVHVVSALKDEESDKIISSSACRILLKRSEVKKAADFLGYRYTIRAPVIRGNALGRTLGFPTANMALTGHNIPGLGIYAVRFRRNNGKLYNGIASFGHRPTMNKVTTPLLETHLFDFSDNLYGEECYVSFFFYLREERKFEGIEQLVAQINRDVAKTRFSLKKVKPLSAFDLYQTFTDWSPSEGNLN